MTYLPTLPMPHTLISVPRATLALALLRFLLLLLGCLCPQSLRSLFNLQFKSLAIDLDPAARTSEADKVTDLTNLFPPMNE